MKENRYTVRTLASMLNANEGTLANKLNGTRGIDIETVCAILELFPQLSADWLLLGNGSMTRQYEMGAHILQVNDEGDNIQKYQVSGNDDCRQFIDMLKEKDRQIAELIDIIKRK
ncbi:MAG: hypothetical protein J5705_04340 [Bacteroidaceae bacterium]|nr:hypothetical protein [Bacteroidaceae bacterium]